MDTPLDRIDVSILRALQHDGRISNRDLARVAGLSPSSCLARVRRLREAGVITGVHAVVDPDALGIGLQAMVSLRLRAHSREAFRAFREHLRGLREVLAIYQLAGDMDFFVHVAVRDTQHLRDLVMDHLATREEVDKFETRLIYDHDRAEALPVYRDPPR